jgi:hypothetical protein
MTSLSLWLRATSDVRSTTGSINRSSSSELELLLVDTSAASLPQCKAELD